MKSNLRFEGERVRARLRDLLALTIALVALLGASARVLSAQNAYWPLDEGSGSTTADSSGNSNTGALVNSPTWATGKIGGGLTFNGTTAYVSANGSGNLANLHTTGMTVMAWIKPSSTGGGGFGRIVDKGNAASSNGWWFTMYSATTLRLQVATFGSPVLFRESSSSIAMGVWQHVAATWDGSTNGNNVHIYVNGVLSDGVSVQSATGTAQDDSPLAVAIGNRAADGARGFDGGIDDVRIYNSVLTAAQIQAIANDSQAPGAPGGLSATAVSSAQVNLSWSAATDNVGVASYVVERCQGSSCTNFAQIATPTTTTYNDTGRTASTTYRYRIRAIDAAGLKGAYSSIATATTSAGSAGPASTAYWAFNENSGTSTADSSGNGVTGTLVNTPTWSTGKIGSALSFSGTTPYVSAGSPGSLANLHNSGMTVMAWIKPNSTGGGGLGRIVDKGNTASSNGWWFTMYSSTSLRLQVATFGSPVIFRESGSSIAMGVWQHVAATWDGSKNGNNVHIYVNGVLSDGSVQSATGTAQSDSALTLAIGNRASDQARGFDGAIDDVRIYSSVLSAAQIQTIANDSQAPTTPGSFAATVASSSQINLSWSASTDNVGVASYVIERCAGSSCTNFAPVASPTGTSYNDTGLSASTTYRYRIRAVDPAGLQSAVSAIVNATTSAGGGGDTTPPTAPSGLAATAVSSSQINLSWTASTDNVGVTGYRVERCQGSGCSTFAEIATSATTSFSDTGRSASTSYSYRVRATDAVPNFSNYSNTASATTGAPGDVVAPSTPTGLLVIAASSNEIDLAWNASTDNVAVTGYVVERCQGAGCSSWSTVATPTVTRFNDMSRAPSTSYSYRISARDGAGNTSSPSSVVTYVTPASSPDCN